ncbi:MAG: nucleoside deaminase [Candidatus Izimaplasma sp.]|nr:nucleoside deaminase [Candidatus Izimaplasma bacterium]
MNHSKYMKMALEQAREGADMGEVPIGAVIVYNSKVIAKAHNLREKLNIATGHAEIIAIEMANKKLKSWRLDSCTLYVTIEPCPMCAGAIIQSRIKNVVYGAYDKKSGAHKSVINLFEVTFNHKVEIESGIMEKECGEILTKFFTGLRKKR